MVDFYVSKQKKKKVALTFFEVKSQQQKYAWCIYRFNCLKKDVYDHFTKCYKNGTNNVFKGKQATNKVLMLLLECKMHI